LKKLDEDTALARIFANTRRKKRTADLITVARAFDYLCQLYGSQKAVADKVGLSPEIVREFRAVLRLSPQVQGLVRARKIDSLDVAYRIGMVRDSAKQVEMAKRLMEARSGDVRDVRRLAEKSDLSVQKAERIVFESSFRGLHVFVIDFDEEQYQQIRRRARSNGVQPAVLVQHVILEWLRKKGSPKTKK
jgi:hypothetical protein